MFVLKHQDGDIEYSFEKGGFAIVDSKLTISIEATALGEESFPDKFMFALEAYPLTGFLKSANFALSTNPNDEPPNVHVYTTFHAMEVYASLNMKVLSPEKIVLGISVVSDDVNYYNEKARPNEFVGEVVLEKAPLEKLWVPA